MAEPNSKCSMCIKTALQQIMTAVKEEDIEDIVGDSESSESDLSDKNDSTHVAPTIKTRYSETNVIIVSTYSTDYEIKSEEEDKNPLDNSPSAPDTSLPTSD